MKHIRTIVLKGMRRDIEADGCGECQNSCQSACKTSCTVSNQICLKKKLSKK